MTLAYARTRQKLGRPRGAGAKIVVVGYADVIAERTAFMLRSEGYFVETAANGDVAFDLRCQYLAEAQPFNFALTGREQPGMNGIDLVEAIT